MATKKTVAPTPKAATKAKPAAKKPAAKKPAAKKPAAKKPAAKARPRLSKKAPARPFTTDQAELAFAHFLPLAEKVPREGLAPCRVDVALCRENLERGVASLRAELPRAKRALPGLDLVPLLELPALGLALAHAASRVTRPTPSAEVEKRLAQMRPMREAALRQLEVFALIDLIPDHVPAAIRKGSGALDHAQDALAIPSVFQENDELIGHRHPFTSAMLKKLGEDGDWLVERLAPLEEAREEAERSPEAVVQNQLWALLTERHQQLRRLGALLFGLQALDARVPPLHAKSSMPKGDRLDEGRAAG
jgi:hypothetical protein